jgi:hypothetical protein
MMLESIDLPAVTVEWLVAFVGGNIWLGPKMLVSVRGSLGREPGTIRVAE